MQTVKFTKDSITLKYDDRTCKYIVVKEQPIGNSSTDFIDFSYGGEYIFWKGQMYALESIKMN